ncbi:hypothetical protein [Kluyvera ascorbata]|uniref:hypothetical protein n=1 Tax=Kluyvera ascorbata TaxID=51288 RepID=UPI002DC00DE8|nr:hypothetical protein [Kluyvera ascorbata]MEB6390860.1 hypothetical protein [Kluyvera ascorbata]
MKLQIKESRDKKIALAFIGLSSLFAVSILGNAITGSLAWYFYKTRDQIITPMAYNQPFNTHVKSGDSSALRLC